MFELEHITKRFPTVTALDDVTFSFEDGEFFVLLGPTGAGKTTTLRIIAGLEKPDSGTIVHSGQRIDVLTPAERDVAFVFQQYSLYPTMTVYDNLAFPLRFDVRLQRESVPLDSLVDVRLDWPDEPGPIPRARAERTRGGQAAAPW